MKNQKLIITMVIAFLMGICFISCGDRSGSNSQGHEDAREANGTIDGTERPAANENSGRASEEGTDAGPATDTLGSRSGNTGYNAE